ncbi:MAG TPA: hypothetical protein DCS21_06310 [Gammaproteobacteria bacterium]|nr:hypothetical protein [Gammaproteobacteria bacterium]
MGSSRILVEAVATKSRYVVNHLIEMDCRAGLIPLSRLKVALQHQLHRKYRRTPRLHLGWRDRIPFAGFMISGNYGMELL